MMRAFLIGLTLAGGSTAAEKATLTAKEIQDGWILLFDGESDFGLSLTGNAKVEKGVIVLGPNMSGQAQTAVVPPGVYFAGPHEIKHGKTDFIHFGQHNDNPGTWGVVKYRPDGMTHLFNGKDLTGWKLFKGEAKRELTKFEVTKEGELHLRSGPGDLQTEKSFADFLLQFECKTNGNGLNSGVFFRCLPGQYQQGYECQIQNSFQHNDRTKPTDFGTGAIYRRIAARKVVSNDQEWFTVTVLAVGPNIRTWVNGDPVVNWTDDRKPADNARQGLYTKAGPISLQGHDPTTDIHFRNIRVVEVKK